ncbi:MAG TPA: RluA family pseudouridine synthase [Bacteroidota bacterium]|nr:RluA family pseudouridine synthase [Bacteroidota bacterium]
MKNHYELTVSAGQSRVRLDVFLTRHVENATRTKVQEAIDNGEVRVNNQVVKASYKVAPMDLVSVHLEKPDLPTVEAEAIPLEIVYEDDYLLVVNKPPGMVTHPAYKNYSGTLVNALMHHTRTLSNPDPMRPGIVHRLDKDTSGLLVVAKDETTHHKLSRQFAEKTSEREYNAIAWGIFSEPEGTIEAALGRSKKDRKKVAVMEDGKHAVTEYLVLEQFEYCALIRLRLRTGRTHQIRAHLAHIHHPIFGDPTYGGREIVSGGVDGKKKAEVKNLLDCIDRQALHARTLGFTHPATNERMRFETELPADFQRVLDRLRMLRNQHK